MSEYLAVTEIVDWQDPDILQLAHQLASADTNATTKACFEWVRDNIAHSSDYQLNPVTCTASSVLHHQTGYCFAKSHLLAALLRANSIPAGFCYQRLSVFDNGAPYSLHGFNAAYLSEFAWYRLDARGNKPGINAQFNPPQEQLAFKINLVAEIDCQHVFAEPLPEVIRTLQTYQTWDEVLHNLPDVEHNYLASFNQKVSVSK
ncbi:MAG: transglutaminase family protein [Cyanobacteria bacterium P01_A01_bin.83]